MDLSFRVQDAKFNYRVCGLILSGDCVLAMQDEHAPYFYLPGGRVQLGETAEEAILRELREELDIEAAIQRPLWLCQNFFTEDVDQVRYHELCLYFLLDASRAGLPLCPHRGPPPLPVPVAALCPAERPVFLSPVFKRSDLPPAGHPHPPHRTGVDRLSL